VPPLAIPTFVGVAFLIAVLGLGNAIPTWIADGQLPNQVSWHADNEIASNKTVTDFWKTRGVVSVLILLFIRKFSDPPCPQLFAESC
jgi:hypothetical protein